MSANQRITPAINEPSMDNSMEGSERQIILNQSDDGSHSIGRSA
jgi:hypothetical protein